MPLSEAYMHESMDLFRSIDEALESIDINIASIGNIIEENLSTLSGLSASTVFTSKSTKTEGKDLSGALSNLTSRIDNLANIIEKSGGGGKSGGGKDKDKDFVSTLKELGEIGGSVGKFATRMALAVPAFVVVKPFIGLIAGTIAEFIDKVTQDVNKRDVTKAKEIGEMMSSVGAGILGFAGKMALAAPLLVLAVPGMFVFGKVTDIITSTMKTIGAREKTIDKGTSGLNKISISLVSFSGSLALSALLMSTISAKGAIGLTALFGVGALSIMLFDRIGENAGDVAKGSLGILAMSASLAVFSASLAYSAGVMEDVSIGSLAKLGLGLAGLGLIFGLAGKVWSEIALGSLAFGLVGIALRIISEPIAEIAGVYGEHPNALWQIPVGLLGLGTVFGIAGAGPVPIAIALGAVALGLAGGALWVIGKGVGAFMDAVGSADEDTGTVIESVLAGVINGFGRGFSGLSATEVLTLPLKIPMVALMGGAIGVLGFGLSSYMKRAGSWDTDDTETLKNTISGLSEAFALAGSTDGMSKLFGFSVGKNDTERGIESTMRMGRNLSQLASGIKAWKELTLTQDEVQLISDNIGRVLNFIPGIFAEIGVRERGSSNQMDIFGVKIGVPFTSSDTELGIESTIKMGRNLMNLANGIKAWKDLTLTIDEVQLISDNIDRVLNFIPGIFAKIGKREAGSTSDFNWFGLSFKNPFSSGDIERGIESTMDMGENLSKLADGVIKWKNFDIKSIDKIKTNIDAILSVIPKAFADIGKAEKETDGFWFWQDGDMEKGIDIIEGISEPLMSIGNLMDSFKNIEDPKKHGIAVGEGIKSMLTSITEGLVGMDDSHLDRLDRLIKPLKKLPDLFKNVNEVLKDHVDIITGMSEPEMNSFRTWADSLEKISNAKAATISKGAGFSRNIGTIDQHMAETNANNMFSTAGIAKQTVPVSKETPNVVAAKSNTEIDELKRLVNQLTGMMQALLTTGNEQNKNLGAINSTLLAGIKVKDGDPMGM